MSRPPQDDIRRKALALERLAAEDNECRRCSPGAGSPRYVFGAGNPGARLVFVGEAPGLEEDRRGQPFVGRSGKLLDRLIGLTGFRREQVYITNIFKCHPMRDPASPDRRGNDRAPTAKETARCLPVVERQIEIIGPEAVCTLGNAATRALLRTREGIGTLHGRVLQYRGALLVATFHPSAVLRNPLLEETVLRDLRALREILERPRSAAAR